MEKTIKNVICAIMAIAVIISCTSPITTEVEVKTKLSVPTILPDATSLNVGEKIKIYPPETASDAIVYYSIDSEDEYIEYAEPIVIDKNLSGNIVVRAYADKTGYNKSTIVSKTYKINTEDKTVKLTSLKPSEGSLNEDFSESVFKYTMTVGSDVETINFEYTCDPDDAEVTVNDGEDIELEEGNNIISIVVEKNGVSKEYEVDIYRESEGLSSNTNLSMLTVSSGTLTPEFNKKTLEYTVKVGSTVSSITFLAKTEDTGATLNYTETLTLVEGENVEEITVTAEDKKTKIVYVVTVTKSDEETETPIVTASPSSKTFTDSVAVTLTVSPSTATIYYTTDGSTPTKAAGKKYSSGLIFTATTTLKVIAVGSDGTESEVETYTYTKSATETPVVTASPASKTFTDSVAVTLTVSPSTATIYYTTDGSTPTKAAGKKYSSGLTFTATTTLKVMAVGSDGTESGVVSFKYTKSSGETSAYYATNPNGKVGVNKTISSFSDWSTDMIIAQGAANDDPRAFRGYHEKATDFYALFAAYDDTNLYLMVEMPSIDGRDITSKDLQYALDENLGMGVVINTGKRTAGDGEMDTGITAWHKSKFYSIQDGIDTLLMFHPSEYGTPGFFITNSEGKFSYTAPYCLKFTDKGVVTSKEVGLISPKLYGRSDNHGLTEAEYLAKTDYVDMLTDTSKTGVTGYKYQIKMSLAGLGIDKAYLESNGIGVMVFSTFGTSIMDALPWNSKLIDCAKDAYSADSSSSQEKEDIDEIATPLARVGKQ